MFFLPIIRKLVVLLVMLRESLKNIFEQDPNNTNDLDSSPGANIDDALNADDASHAEDASFKPNIFDPRYWNSLDSK
jgi:hypothetical protein